MRWWLLGRYPSSSSSTSWLGVRLFRLERRGVLSELSGCWWMEVRERVCFWRGIGVVGWKEEMDWRVRSTRFWVGGAGVGVPLLEGD